MKYSEAHGGRIFVIRLEDGDILHEAIETFALDHHVERAALIALGGADEGSRLVVGPEESRTEPVVPMEYVLPGVHEIAGVGTLFPDSSRQAGPSYAHNRRTQRGCCRGVRENGCARVERDGSDHVGADPHEWSPASRSCYRFRASRPLKNRSSILRSPGTDAPISFAAGKSGVGAR